MNTMDDTLEFNVFNVPILSERPWVVFAACKDEQGMAFFPQTRDEEMQALTICGICPVSDDCLDHALATNERFGVWGGTTEKERRRLSRMV